MKSRTPQELMQLIQRGDEDAFRELMRRFKQPITMFVLRMLNDPSKAVEVAQEAFVNIFTHAQSYRPTASFSGWIYRIAHNLAINEIRRTRRQPTVSIDAVGNQGGSETPVFEPADTRPSAEEAVLGNERRAMVRRCIAALPWKYRSAIVMKDMEGLTFLKIAAILDCPESTAKSRVMRARRMLKRRLEPYVERVSAATPVRPIRQDAGS
ncbi:MAG: RNA polymerase sigma factor [Acidobacteriota bacterium]